jgi:hypothetical protein
MLDTLWGKGFRVIYSFSLWWRGELSTHIESGAVRLRPVPIYLLSPRAPLAPPPPSGAEPRCYLGLFMTGLRATYLLRKRKRELSTLVRLWGQRFATAPS